MNRAHSIAWFSLPIALFAVSCSKNQPAAPPAATTTTQAPSTTTTQPPAPTATTASVTPAAPTPGAIASTDGERQGAHIDVTELKRTSGGTVTLQFVLTNNSSTSFATVGNYFGDPQVSKDSYRDLSGIHLLDPANKKKYFVVTDSEKSCVCSKNIDDIAAGGRASLWAKFPAPPPEVTKVTVEIPHFQPMDDVPISQ